MDEEPKNKWFFMREYPKEKPDTPEQEPTLAEMKIEVKRLHQKMDMLIESNKNLIAYFSSLHERDVRELNYKIRSYASKSRPLPPTNFVASKIKPKFN